MLSLFSEPEEAVLIERPNRFVMIARDRTGAILRLHCPNPGKLTEFIIPGQKLLITRSTSPERLTDGTAVAVIHKGKTIFLYSAKANDIAGQLILPEIYPGRIIITEYTMGHSRFDFFIPPISKGKGILAEVKSCSLCEEKLAMFPDTATERGSRHVEELIEFHKIGYETEVIFVVSHKDAESFMPNPHTDTRFCLALHKARRIMPVRAVSVSTGSDGRVEIVNPELPIETAGAAALAEKNRGIYFLVIRLDNKTIITVNRIENPLLAPGWYIYAGSAKANLTQRIARHLRKRKKNHWHIDYLTRSASSVKAFPIATERDLECSLARDIADLADDKIIGFGSSDCRCSSHLFYFSENPLHNRGVVDLLFRYRHREFL